MKLTTVRQSAIFQTTNKQCIKLSQATYELSVCCFASPSSWLVRSLAFS